MYNRVYTVVREMFHVEQCCFDCCSLDKNVSRGTIMGDKIKGIVNGVCEVNVVRERRRCFTWNNCVSMEVWF